MSSRSSRFARSIASRVLIAGLLVAGVCGVSATASFAAPLTTAVAHLPAPCNWTDSPYSCLEFVGQQISGNAIALGQNIISHDGRRACALLTPDSQALIVKEAREKFGASGTHDDTCEKAIIAYYPGLPRIEAYKTFEGWAKIVRMSPISAANRLSGFVNAPWLGHVVVEYVGDRFRINLKASNIPSTA
jgi:hypothetical protein